MSYLPITIVNGWASGINAYAVVLLLGLLGRSGFAETPEVLQRTDVLVAAAVLTAIDFVADKIPYLDSAWDAVHTVIRPAIAVVLGALLAGDASSLEQALVAAGSGGTALASHASKASLRLAVNTSPEPASNIGISLLEDLSVVGVVTLAVQHPWLAAGIALVLLFTTATVALLVLSRIRRFLARVRTRWDDRFRTEEAR